LVGLVYRANPWKSEMLDVSIYLCKEANKDVESPWVQRPFWQSRQVHNCVSKKFRSRDFSTHVMVLFLCT
jgi:hypothetical protein